MLCVKQYVVSEGYALCTNNACCVRSAMCVRKCVLSEGCVLCVKDVCCV